MSKEKLKIGYSRLTGSWYYTGGRTKVEITEEMEAVLEDKDKKIADLEAKLAEIEKELMDNEKCFTEKDVEGLIKDREQTIKFLKEQLAEKEEVIKYLKGIKRYDIGEMLTENAKLQQQIAEKEQRVAELECKLNEKQKAESGRGWRLENGKVIYYCNLLSDYKMERSLEDVVKDLNQMTKESDRTWEIRTLYQGLKQQLAGLQQEKIEYTDTINFVETSEPDIVAKELDRLKQQLAEKEELHKLVEEQLKDMEKSKLSWENQYFTIYNTLKNYREVTENKLAEKEKECQDNLHHAEFWQSSYKRCIDRENQDKINFAIAELENAKIEFETYYADTIWNFAEYLEYRIKQLKEGK